MGPGPREGAGACSFAARAGGGGCWERPRRIRRGAMIPAARRRRLSGKRLGRRAVVVAKSAQLRFRLRRKLRPLPCASSPHRAGRGGPHFGLASAKRERAAPGVREKALLAATLHVRAKLLYGGRRERVPACFRQTADGRGGVTQRFGGLIPAARVCLGSGCKEGFDQLLFPRVPLRYALP